MSNDTQVDVSRVLQKLQVKLTDALLTVAVLETRIEDLMKENAELRLFRDENTDTSSYYNG